MTDMSEAYHYGDLKWERVFLLIEGYGHRCYLIAFQGVKASTVVK